VASRSDTHPKNAGEIQAWLINHLAEFLNTSPDALDPGEPFESFGMSSSEMVIISGDLEEWMQARLEPTLVWQYPTIETLSRYLAGEDLDQVETEGSFSNELISGPLAVIGIGCRFPGGNGPDEFWDTLINGVDAISEAPIERWDNKDYFDPELTSTGSINTLWGGFLKDVEYFDNELFKISPREAVRMDPQQRLLLEVTWEALEHAGQAPQNLAGSQTGIFLGISTNDYSKFQFSDPTQIDAYAGSGNAHSVAANRLSYYLDIHGPSIAVDTACSSSLVSIHLAAQSLQNGECDLAIAGGVNVILTPDLTIAFSQARMLASDGRCKTFDASADGYVRGEGCGMVVLKRLSEAVNDQDNIIAIIRGSAINHDGKSNGLTAPNGLSQQAVIRKALSNAGLEPNQISYLEAHGTGTRLGDPIEFDALKAVFQGDRKPDDVLALGSVKTNIGHLESAAGAAGFIKVLLSLKNGTIPPHLHLKEVNPQIDLDGTPFIIPTRAQSWSSLTHGTRYAGVSSFGFGGTNAHLILEAPQERDVDKTTNKDSSFGRPFHILTLSARSEGTLKELSKGYVEFLDSNFVSGPTLPNICNTANTGRQNFKSRLAVVSDKKENTKKLLGAFINGKKSSGIRYNHFDGRKQPLTAYLFTGQGSQYAGMGRQLYETEPAFRNTLNECEEISRPFLEHSLLSVLYPPDGDSPLIHETSYTQPALFSLEYALADLLRDWGIRPDYVLGHSIGEFAAACFAGAFSLEDGLQLVIERGRLMGSLPRDGSMAVIFTEIEPITECVQKYEGKVSIATINGPTNIVVSGETKALQEIVMEFEGAGIECRSLEVSHAFHSPLMEPILKAFSSFAENIDYSPLTLPLASNLSGQIIPAGELLSAEYWMQHIRKPVKFSSGMDSLAARDVNLYIEIGPSPVLTGMGKRLLKGAEFEWLPTLRNGKPDWLILLNSLASMYTKGFSVDWDAFDRNYDFQRIPLPTYPFDRKRFWFESSPSQTRITAAEGDSQTQWLNQLVWEEVGKGQVRSSDSSKQKSYIIFGDEAGLGSSIEEQIKKHGDSCVLVYPGQGYKKQNPNKYFINPAQKGDFSRLFSDLLDAPEHRIIHFWSLNSSLSDDDSLSSLKHDLDIGCKTSLYLVQALDELGQQKDISLDVWFITRGCQQAGPELNPISVSQAPLWGFARTFALEYPELWGGLIDLDPTPSSGELSQLWETLRCPDGEDQIAFRSGKRFAARLQPYQNPRSTEVEFSCSPDVSYLITGGTGALSISNGIPAAFRVGQHQKR